MFERDPRLQLYSVAHACLQRLATDFHTSQLSQLFEWSGHFELQQDAVQQIDFRDEHSRFPATTASVHGLYFDRDDEVSISLQLHTHDAYNREEIKTEAIAIQHELSGDSFTVLTAPSEVPPTLIPAGLYDSIDQSLADVHLLTRAGVCEVLSVARSAGLIAVLQTLQIEQMSTASLDRK